MDELRFGIIGYGTIAQEHLNNFVKIENARVIAVQSRTDKRTKLPKGISFYTNVDAMLSKESLDAILICTPTHTHENYACKCAEHGLDVFIEKPMARSLSQCYEIKDSVRENGVKMTIAHVLRYWPTYGSIYHYLSSNEDILGKIDTYNAKRLGTFPWSAWFADQDQSGGVILDLSIHDIDYALWLFGPPISVSCDAKKMSKHGKNVFGQSITQIKLSKDIIAKCEASWAKPPDFEFFTSAKIQGTRDFLAFDGLYIQENEKWNITNVFTSENGYLNQLMGFVDLLSNKPARINEPVSIEEGILAVKISLAAIKSAEKKGKEIFMDDFFPE